MQWQRKKIILRSIALTVYCVTEIVAARGLLCQLISIEIFISERSNADSGYIRIPITSLTSPFHFPIYPEVNS